MASQDDLAHVIIEPLRTKILLELMHEPKYISQIAADTKIDRSTVSYHLGVLEDAKIVTSKYEILVPPHSKGKAARMYYLDKKKLTEALRNVEKIIPTLTPKDA